MRLLSSDGKLDWPEDAASLNGAACRRMRWILHMHRHFESRFIQQLGAYSARL